MLRNVEVEVFFASVAEAGAHFYTVCNKDGIIKNKISSIRVDGARFSCQSVLMSPWWDPWKAIFSCLHIPIDTIGVFSRIVH